MEENNNEIVMGQPQDGAPEEMADEAAVNAPEEMAEEAVASAPEEWVCPQEAEPDCCIDLPEISPEEQKKNKRRLRNRIILWVALAVFVLTSAASGFVFVNKYFAEPSAEQSEDVPNEPTPSPDSSMPSVSRPGPGVENGPTVTLNDRPDSSVAELTIPEVYQMVSPSVVMILAGNETAMAMGTGIIMSADGYIITNAHVIGDFERVQIVLSDNRTVYDAQIMGTDVASDIAVLKVEADDLTPAVFGDSDQVVIGESVVAIGNPYSVEYAQTVTDGILSGVRKDIYEGDQASNYLQTNAQLNPGNSGGPLINRYGQVIGVNRKRIKTNNTSASYEGMGLAIPINDAKKVVDDLIRYGVVMPEPVVGVTVTYVNKESAVAEDMVAGCMILSIEKDSDAYKQGMRVGDIITTINGKTFEDLDGFIDEKNQYEVGDQVELEYWRMGEYFKVKVTLGEAK